MVILVVTTHAFKHVEWVMILLIWFKAVLTLRISKAQRTLIQMIIECIWAMIPFLIVVIISVFCFALINYELDKQEGLEPNIFEDLG